MASYNETGFLTFRPVGAIAQHLRVKYSSGTVTKAGASDENAIGTAWREAFVATEPAIAVKTWGAPGTFIFVASEAITAGATVYAAADGKVASTGTVIAGIALEAAGADGDWIECLNYLDATIGSVARSTLTQDDGLIYPIPLESGRVWNAFQTNLPGTAATDDLAIIGGTFGTAPPTLQGVDFGGTTTTAYARFRYALPVEYVAGETVTLRAHAGMLTTVADTSCTLDVEAYSDDRDGTVSADLCATSAQSINSLTLANKDFTITATSLTPGEVLDIRIAIAGSDTGNLGVMIPTVTALELLLDVQG